MNLSVLSQLKDVHLPSPPSFWPPAVGYYLVFFLILFTIFLFVFLYKKYHPVRQVKKQVAAELDMAEEQFNRSQDPSLLQAEIASITRRLIAYKARSPITKQKDLSSLEKEWKVLFPKNSKKDELFVLLTKDRYKKNCDIDGQRMLTLARELVRKCRI